jgi:hypothetical protein
MPRFLASPTADRGLGVAASIDDDQIAWAPHLERFKGIDEIAFGELEGEHLPHRLGRKGGLDRAVHHARAVLCIGEDAGRWLEQGAIRHRLAVVRLWPDATGCRPASSR